MEDTLISAPHKRLAVVTGGNKGIGFEICRQLALNGVTVILTARDKNKGMEALQKLKQSSLSDVYFHQLDVKGSASAASLAKFIETNFKSLDILVNNAAYSGVIIHDEPFGAFKDGAGFMEVTDENANLLIGIIEQDYEMAEECLKTNYFGTKRVTEALLPLLQLTNTSRIVNISSNYGELKWIPNENVRKAMGNIESLTEDIIDDILEWFMRDFKEGNLEANGWPITMSAYKLSKAATNAYTRILSKKYPNMLVNCVHPGYIATEFTSNTGLFTPEEGARAPVMVALLPDGGPSGVYFNHMNVDKF